MTAKGGDLSLFDVKRKPGRPRNINVSRELVEAIRAARHLQHEDRGMIELARRLALQVDHADDEKVMLATAGQLAHALDSLGLTPRGRSRLGLAEDPAQEVNPLDELAIIRQSRRSGDVDSGA